MQQPSYIIGIDEAGRGPLAGPVAVGIALVPSSFDWALLPGVGDSKSISEKKRELVYARSEVLDKSHGVVTRVVMKTAKDIDERGIAVVIREAVAEGLETIIQEAGVPVEQCQVLLDGGLTAPLTLMQKTIIRGDVTEPVIGLASIMAKVTRDRYMVRLSSKPAYLAYDFAQHKGYGTKQHRLAVSLHGLSKEHRSSFCRNITLK